MHALFGRTAQATTHNFRHGGNETIPQGAAFENVAAALGNSMVVVAKFYTHERERVTQGRASVSLVMLFASWLPASL
jgi:hypothetical protein